MKKIITLALATLLVLTAFTGCSKKKEDEKVYNVDPVTGYAAGVVEGQTYVNKTIGLKYTADENTYLSGEDEIKEMMSLTADAELTVMYEMFAINADGNIILLTEKLENKDITEDEYLDNLKAQLGEIGTVVTDDGENETVSVGDIEFVSLKYPVKMNVSEEEMYQSILVRKYDDRMLSITLTYENDGAFEVLMSGFSEVE